MVQVSWTPVALKTLEEVVKYTNAKFGPFQVDRLEKRLLEVEQHIAKYPTANPFDILAQHYGEYRFVMVFKTLKLLYRVVDEDHCLIVLLWNTRKNPSKMKVLLNK